MRQLLDLAKRGYLVSFGQAKLQDRIVVYYRLMVSPQEPVYGYVEPSDNHLIDEIAGAFAAAKASDQQRVR
jgi:hypothetical protein